MNGCSKNARDNAAAAKLGIMCKQPQYDSLAAKELSHNPQILKPWQDTMIVLAVCNVLHAIEYEKQASCAIAIVIKGRAMEPKFWPCWVDVWSMKVDAVPHTQTPLMTAEEVLLLLLLQLLLLLLWLLLWLLTPG